MARPEFINKQYEFAAHIRDPENNPRPADVEQRRMNIYNELFYNNVEGFMADTFPVLRSITSDTHWHAMIRDYFSRHQSHTPLFPEMPREFLKYLESEREPHADDFPFQLELAHYEWVELALLLSDLDKETDWSRIDTEGDLLTSRPVLSPVAWPLSYHYPVQQISTDFIPQQESGQPVHLLVYRGSDDIVHFMEINPITARLIQLLVEDNNLNGQQITETIAREINHPNIEVVIQGGLQILHDLKTRNIILGVNKT